MIHMGIDGGLQGAIVAMEGDDIIKLHKMPVIKGERNQYDIRAICEILRRICHAHSTKQVRVVLEKAQPTMIAGRVAMFSMGYCFGMMQGILSSLDVSYTVVPPKTWQKRVLTGIPAKDTKQASIIWAMRKYPMISWKRTERSTLMHDGLTDAAAMAYYSYLEHNGEKHGNENNDKTGKNT